MRGELTFSLFKTLAREGGGEKDPSCALNKFAIENFKRKCRLCSIVAVKLESRCELVNSTGRWCWLGLYLSCCNLPAGRYIPFFLKKSPCASSIVVRVLCTPVRLVHSFASSLEAVLSPCSSLNSVSLLHSPVCLEGRGGFFFFNFWSTLYQGKPVKYLAASLRAVCLRPLLGSKKLKKKNALLPPGVPPSPHLIFVCVSDCKVWCASDTSSREREKKKKNIPSLLGSTFCVKSGRNCVLCGCNLMPRRN